jgi:hypothetical protein
MFQLNKVGPNISDVLIVPTKTISRLGVRFGGSTSMSNSAATMCTINVYRTAYTVRQRDSHTRRKA